MSGGCLNYLCYKDFPEICNCIGELEEVEKRLIKHGDIDIAKDVRRLIEYINSAEIRIDVLANELADVFHAVEWMGDGDISEDDMTQTFEDYRRKIGK